MKLNTQWALLENRAPKQSTIWIAERRAPK